MRPRRRDWMCRACLGRVGAEKVEGTEGERQSFPACGFLMQKKGHVESRSEPADKAEPSWRFLVVVQGPAGAGRRTLIGRQGPGPSRSAGSAKALALGDSRVPLNGLPRSRCLAQPSKLFLAFLGPQRVQIELRTRVTLVDKYASRCLLTERDWTVYGLRRT